MSKTFDDVSVNDIAGFAFGRALDDQLKSYGDHAWFMAYARNRIAYHYDIRENEIVFSKLDVYASRQNVDIPTFTVDVKWYYYPMGDRA